MAELAKKKKYAQAPDLLGSIVFLKSVSRMWKYFTVSVCFRDNWKDKLYPTDGRRLNMLFLHWVCASLEYELLKQEVELRVHVTPQLLDPPMLGSIERERKLNSRRWSREPGWKSHILLLISPRNDSQESSSWEAVIRSFRMTENLIPMSHFAEEIQCVITRGTRVIRYAVPIAVAPFRLLT